MEISFNINGKPYTISPKNVPVDTSLNTYIREYAELRGTKFMCLEGGCGSCLVVLKGIHPVDKTQKTWAVNSCLKPIYSCDGLDIITIEGLGNKKDGYHAIQKRLAHLNGTQCGYCSPAMVMNMYGLLESKKGQITMNEVENSFGGNICRCTGYRPILDAFKGLTIDATDELKNMCADIEDFVDFSKICSKTGKQCSRQCKSSDKIPKSLKIVFNDEREWHKVYTIKEIIDIFNNISTKSYILISGNTAHGVYRRDPNIQIFIDINNVQELKEYTIGDENLILGANLSLTETMDIFEEAAKKKPEFEYLRELNKHIDLIANIPVRNSGTIAGNLSIKNQHNEFPSDMYLIFETVGAHLTVMDTDKTTKDITVKDYIQTNMNKKILTKISLPKLLPGKVMVRSFKVMPRAQNAHAFVNAGFLFELDDDHKNIIRSRICFGGINPSFTHAEETEKCLIGKSLYDNNVLKDAFNKLQDELNPDWVLPDASPEFRKNLAMSLFYKFVLNTCPDVLLKPEYKSGGEVLKRDLSSGKQMFDTYKDKWPLTKPVQKLEGLAQCSGEAKYVNDIPHLPNEVWAAYVIATEVHAKISSIDASDALKIPGVIAFYSAKDIPGKNNFAPKSVGMVEEEEIFCSGEVLFHGQPAGIIVAESFTLANYAASFVKILYEKNDSSMLSTLWGFMGSSETKKPILSSIQEVLKANAIDRIYDTPYNKEATSVGLNSTKKLSGRFEIDDQYHFTMETQICICIPTENGLDVYSASQWMDLVQVAIAQCLNIQENKINTEVRRLGGGYGAKISRQTQVACAAALACYKLNRPVRFILTIESNMTTVGKRYSCVNDYDVEVDDDGKIQKLTNNFYEDYGIALNEDVVESATRFFKNVYENASWTVTSKRVKTDSPSSAWCRAPGTTEGIAMIENIMEHISNVTKQTREHVRMVNMAENHPMKKMYEDFLKDVDFENRKSHIKDFNSTNRWRKRGIATIPMDYHVGYFGSFPALVSIYHADGTVAITHGGIEMGQGINTKVAQVAAHILGIDLEMIDVKPSNNVAGANSFVSGGSVSSESVSFAVKKACEMLVERIKPVREKLGKNAKWEEITAACYAQNIDLIGKYMYKAGDARTYSVYGCSCAEIEIDLLTGNMQLLRVDILEDTGESMSPYIDIGQIEGGFIMGIGYYLTENLIYNRENGELLTTRTWNYKVPGAKDIPIDFRVKFLQKSSNPNGVLRAKAVGEPSFCMSIVVQFAFRNALNAARKESGLTGWYNLGTPCSPETVFEHSGTCVEQFQL